MEVLVVWRRHGFKAEVIDDEQWGFDNIEEAPLEGVCGAGSVELSQQLGLCGEQDVVPGSNGPVSQGLCDVPFASAAASGDQWCSVWRPDKVYVRHINCVAADEVA